MAVPKECSDSPVPPTISRKLNALELLASMDALSSAFDQAEREFNDGARVVLIRAEGRVFSSGIDLTQFASLGEEFGDKLRINSD